MVYMFGTYPVGKRYPKVEWDGGHFPTPDVLEEFDDGLPTRTGRMAGVPVDGSGLIKQVRWCEPRYNPPPDFDGRPSLNVSERAKQVIETLEPGVHQFFPVDYFNRKGELIEKRYWFYICNRRDTIDPITSNMAVDKWGQYISPVAALKIGVDLPPYFDPDQPSEWVLDGSKIGDNHMWREPRTGGSPMMSDAMWQAIQDAGLTGLKLRKVEVFPAGAA